MYAAEFTGFHGTLTELIIAAMTDSQDIHLGDSAPGDPAQWAFPVWGPDAPWTDLLPASCDYHAETAPRGQRLPWRHTGGELHAATAEGLAHGVAWAAGQWAARHLLASLLTDPDEAARLLAESDLDG